MGKKHRNPRAAKRPKIVAFGPGMTIESVGDMTMLRSQRTPEEHSALIANVQAFHRRFESDMKSKVAQLEDLFAKFDTFDLLGQLMLELFYDPETYEEPQQAHEDAMVEYAAMLCLKSPYSPGTDTSLAETYPDIQKRLTEIISQTIIYQYTQGIEDHERMPATISELQKQSYIEALLVRNPGYAQHETQVLNSLFSPSDTWFIDNLGFTVNDLLMLDSALMQLLNCRFQETRDAAKRDCNEAWQQYQTYRNGLHAGSGQPPLFKRLNTLPITEAKSALQAIYGAEFAAHLGAVLSFTAIDLANASGVSVERTGNALAFFSLEFGTNKPEFVLPIPFHPLTQWPFIKHGERYMCPNRKLFLWSIQPRLEGALKASSASSNLFNRYADRRAEYLEKEALRLLSEALGGAKTYHSLKYTWAENGQRCEGELDGLVIYDDVVFLLEAKAGAFPLKARKGYDRAIYENLKSLVADAHCQALTAQHYLQQNPAALFHLPDRTTLTLERSSFRKVILVAVTLDSLDVFCTNLHRLSDLGLFDTSENLPWSVPLLVLRIIAETVDFPSQLIHFLGRRLLLNGNRQMEAHDELDWWGHYLAEGLMFNHTTNPKISRISLMSFTGSFDKYYAHQLGERVTPSPKPQQQMPDVFRKAILSIEHSGIKGRTTVIGDFLDMAGEGRQKFATLLAQCHEGCKSVGNVRDFTMVFNEGGFGLTCFVATSTEASRASFELYEHCQVKKYQARLPCWICLLSLTEQSELIQTCYVLNSPWQEDPELKRRTSILEKSVSGFV